jgi:hypothetical protein
LLLKIRKEYLVGALIQEGLMPFSVEFLIGVTGQNSSIREYYFYYKITTAIINLGGLKEV